MLNKKTLITILIIILLVFLTVFFYARKTVSRSESFSYEDCVRNGGQVTEFTPEECISPEGIKFRKNTISKIDQSKIVQRQEKICPDAWVDNLTPINGKNKKVNGQYIVAKGKTININDVDLNWVEENCRIKQPVILFD